MLLFWVRTFKVLRSARTRCSRSLSRGSRTLWVKRRRYSCLLQGLGSPSAVTLACSRLRMSAVCPSASSSSLLSSMCAEPCIIFPGTGSLFLGRLWLRCLCERRCECPWACGPRSRGKGPSRSRSRSAAWCLLTGSVACRRLSGDMACRLGPPYGPISPPPMPPPPPPPIRPP
ncbi:hypothetical protein EYF80_055295 [Liparis tanakae]|uniref:Uncharacterized protein n=1 Tax=Liparis tanakae TaxID=230148 RepID=A0A4Z2F235_9TELE|nr:hypothetical protein EYF80_055295 [Liparis tanakae]